MPSGWKNFSPLYWGGLCEAEIWMPPAAPRSRTRRPSVGVADGAGEQDITAGRGHGRQHRRDEDRGRDPAIVPHHDRAPPATGGIGRRELDHDRRVEAVPDDPPQPRDTRDSRPAHVRLPGPFPLGPTPRRAPHSQASTLRGQAPAAPPPPRSRTPAEIWPRHEFSGETPERRPSGPVRGINPLRPDGLKSRELYLARGPRRRPPARHRECLGQGIDARTTETSRGRPARVVDLSERPEHGDD